jgi:hypothetical protein
MKWGWIPCWLRDRLRSDTEPRRWVTGLSPPLHHLTQLTHSHSLTFSLSFFPSLLLTRTLDNKCRKYYHQTTLVSVLMKDFYDCILWCRLINMNGNSDPFQLLVHSQALHVESSCESFASFMPAGT